MPHSQLSQAAPAVADEQPPLVLVVDDTDDNRELYAQMLRDVGYRVLEANSGVDGLAKAMAEVPDLIVMDLAMPDLDGWEATRRIKADARTRAIPVFVLTGVGLSGYARAAEVGCDTYLVKPCLPEDLVGLVRLKLDAPPAAYCATSAQQRKPVE